jgi:hypothetical protein
VIGLISHFSTKFFASSIQLVQPTNLETPAPINIANFLSLTALNFDSKNIDNHRLYKIHGCVSDEESLIFTKNKYIEAYASQVKFDPASTAYKP